MSWSALTTRSPSSASVLLGKEPEQDQGRCRQPRPSVQGLHRGERTSGDQSRGRKDHLDEPALPRGSPPAMKTAVRRVDLTRSEVDYLSTAGLLPPTLLECLGDVRWRSGVAVTLEISAATAEEFREVFTERLAKVGFDEACKPTPEGRLVGLDPWGASPRSSWPPRGEQSASARGRPSVGRKRGA